MKTRVVLTVDVEPSIAGAFDAPGVYTPLIDQPVWGAVSGKSEALGFIIRTLRNYGLSATFFVETVHASFFSSKPMGRYVAELVEANQDVQLHLHPMWCRFCDGKLLHDDTTSDDCHQIEAEKLIQIVSEGITRIESWTGKRPASARTGNFSTDRNVFVAMRKAGLQFSSNICSAIQKPMETGIAFMGGAHEIEGIIELPVTCFSDSGPVGRGRPRPMQITACSFTETRNLLNRLHANGGTVAVIVTHPFEFLKSDDYRYSNIRPNRMVQTRFEKLCAFLANNSDRFQTESLGNAATSLKTPSSPPPLSGSPIHSVARAVQNVINDRFR